MKQALKKLRQNYDWLIVVLITTVLIAVGILAYYLANRPVYSDEDRNTSKLHYQTEQHGLQEIVPPDPKYPVPADNQRGFYTIYSTGDIQYSIEWSVRNVERAAEIGQHKFTVNLYNSLNRDVTVENAADLTVGCIATDNPYQELSLSPQTYTFGPYETKKIELPIDVSCIYIGTADGEYFWRIY